MTVIDKFYNYQSNPNGFKWNQAPFNSCLPRPTEIRRYMEQRWGCVYLGCHVDREVRDGGSVSTHSFGAVPDMRYADPGPGIHVAQTEILPWLIGTSGQTGVQAIHDYYRCQIWRPPGQSGRSPGSDGWKVQRPGGNMGATWAKWFHVEIHPDYVFLEGSIWDLLAGTIATPVPTPPIVIINPEPTPFVPGKEVIMQGTYSIIRGGSVGNDVKRCQALLNTMFGQDVGTPDGRFGPRTSEGVANVQRFFGLKVDSIVGPQTWAIIGNLPE